MKPLIWEAQKLLAGRYYGPISETHKVHMQLCDESDGFVEPLVDQSLYCDMRAHTSPSASGGVRTSVFALGACTRNSDNKLKKDVPELAIICNVVPASLDEINDQLESVSDGSSDIVAFLENNRTGLLGYASKVTFFAWSKDAGELRPTDEADFHAKYCDLLEQVGIER